MDDFSTFARDFGLRPQGKAAPMTQSRPSDGSDRPPMFDDVFGGPPKYSNSKSTSSFSDFDYDSIFKMSENSSKKGDVKSTSSPVYDKPMYDEDVDVDIFDGLPGVKSKSTSGRVNYDENVFATMTNQKQNRDRDQSAAFDDLLGNLGQGEKVGSKSSKSSKGFDDLLPGFGSSSPQRSSRLGSESNPSQKTSSSSTKPTSSVVDDPFDVLKSTSTPVSSSPKVFTDPLDEIGKLANSAKTKANNTSVGGPVFSAEHSDSLIYALGPIHR